MSKDKKTLSRNFKIGLAIGIAAIVVVGSSIGAFAYVQVATPRLVYTNDMSKYDATGHVNLALTPFLSMENYANSVKTKRVEWNNGTFWASASLLTSLPYENGLDAYESLNETKVEGYLKGVFKTDLYCPNGSSKIFFGNMTVSPGGWQYVNFGQGVKLVLIEMDSMYNGTVIFRTDGLWWMISLLYGPYVAPAVHSILLNY